jgi:hypothetical protein
MPKPQAQTSANLRTEACALLTSATERIQNANLNNDDEWKTAVDSALTDMESASSQGISG